MIQRELAVVQSLQSDCDNEASSFVGDVVTRMLSVQLSWQRHVETQLQQHGIKTASGDDDIGELLMCFRSKGIATLLLFFLFFTVFDIFHVVDPDSV